jgi:succinate dehydrogenase / fumarate reductase cytochrome b subunit
MSDVAGEQGARARPQYRNLSLALLLRYRLPIPGIASILHRVSGALLFLVGIPLTLYLLQQSITSEISFQSYREFVSNWFVKLVLLALIWSYLHHFFAGIRFLFLDIHVGVEKEKARASATAVMVVSLILTFILGLKLFGVF